MSSQLMLFLKVKSHKDFKGRVHSENALHFRIHDLTIGHSDIRETV